MPDRDYYLSEDAKFAAIRAKYLAYVANASDESSAAG